MNVEELTGEFKRRSGDAPSLGHKVKFVFDDGGIIFWDGTVTPAIISNEDGEAETTLRLSLANMERMMVGDLEPTLAYMTGKLKIEGSLGVAMKISGYVSD